MCAYLYICICITLPALVAGMGNCTSCAPVYELPQSYCGDNREGTLFS